MVNMPKIFKSDGGAASRERLPLLPLRDIVVFPHMVAPLFVGRDKSVSALPSAMSKDKRVFLATQKKAGVDNPGEKDINPIGVVGSVLQLLRLPDGTVKALVEGKVRGRITNFATKDDYFQVEIETHYLQPVQVTKRDATTPCQSVVRDTHQTDRLIAPAERPDGPRRFGITDQTNIDPILRHELVHTIRVMVLDVDTRLGMQVCELFNQIVGINQSDRIDRCDLNAPLDILVERADLLLQRVIAVY